MAKMYNKHGRFTKKSAKIVVKLLREGKLKGELIRAGGGKLAATIKFDDSPNTAYPYFIGGFWYTEKLRYWIHESTDDSDIVGFDLEEDKELFERKFNGKIQQRRIICLHNDKIRV